ncbi:MAG: hypothetical protein KJ063_09305 [Anaerolineae bacterium]|nr:hypothetical protein [Anaerolineae bacterium]
MNSQEELERFTPRIQNALPFALTNRVVLVKTSRNIPLNISMGLPGYEDRVMERSVRYKIAHEKQVWIYSAEDLIIHKAVAARPQDLRDIEGVVYRQGDKLDAGYIREWLTIFAELLANPDLLQTFERPWKKIGGR